MDERRAREANGTNWNGEFASAELTSHYFYVCECDSEKAAYEQLGPPPRQDNPDAQSTPIPTPEPTAMATAASSGDANQPPQNQQNEELPRTPTAGAGPDFGLVAALGGVLALGLLARRR